MLAASCIQTPGPGSRPLARKVARACLTPVGAGPSPTRIEHSRAWSLQRRLALGGPFEEAPRVAVADNLAIGHRYHPVGGGQAALQPVLDQQHGCVGLLVEPAQLPDQLVTGHRVELRRRLVEQHQRWTRDERGGERDPLELAAGQLAGGPVE